MVNKTGAFVPPPDPEDGTKPLQEELERLRHALDDSRSEAEKARVAAENEARERMSAQERAKKDREEGAVWEQLATEAENAKAALAAQLQTLQTAAAQAPAQAMAAIVAKADAAAAEIDIDEASTRTLIDAALRARGWEVDTQTMRYGLRESLAAVTHRIIIPKARLAFGSFKIVEDQRFKTGTRKSSVAPQAYADNTSASTARTRKTSSAVPKGE